MRQITFTSNKVERPMPLSACHTFRVACHFLNRADGAKYGTQKGAQVAFSVQVYHARCKFTFHIMHRKWSLFLCWNLMLNINVFSVLLDGQEHHIPFVQGSGSLGEWSLFAERSERSCMWPQWLVCCTLRNISECPPTVDFRSFQ